MVNGEVIKNCCGCGYCCMKARCAISMLVFDINSKDCPALFFEDGRFWCRLAEQKTLKKALYIGDGCSSTMFNTQREAFLRGKGEDYVQSRLGNDKKIKFKTHRQVRRNDQSGT